MSGFATNTTDHLIRSQLWSTELKDVLLDDLMGMRYVKMIDQFPDGDTINIPSIGQAEVLDYAEGQAVMYNSFDTGNFQFSITDYVQSGTHITNKMKQDSYLMSELVSSFVPKQHRAIMERIETDVHAVGPDNQTSADYNLINGARHRWVGQGTGDQMIFKDFAQAKYALQKANVPLNNLVAIVDPTVELLLSTQTNVVNLSNANPNWENVIAKGLTTGMKFLTNIFGFDVYVSNYLKSGISETIGGNSVTNGVANIFFSADSTVVPIIGQLRQPPKVDSEYNKDFQRDEYVTTARWGFDLYRPENFVTVITDTTQAYA